MCMLASTYTDLAGTNLKKIQIIVVHVAIDLLLKLPKHFCSVISICPKTCPVFTLVSKLHQSVVCVCVCVCACAHVCV